MGLSELKVENELLREEVRTFHQQRRTELEQRLEQALASTEHFKQEAYRNAEIGRKIAAESQAEIAILRDKVNANHRIENQRPTFEAQA